MAALIALRAAIVLAPVLEAGALVTYRVLNGPIPGPTGQALAIGRSFWDRLRSSVESDAELSDHASLTTGSVLSVTTYTAPFEHRRLMLKMARAAGGSVPDDFVYCSFDLLRTSAAAPSTDWVDADYVAVEGLFDTWFGVIKTHYPTTNVLSEYRWYRAGPVFDAVDADGNRTGPEAGPPVRVTTKATAGTNSLNTHTFPHQVALSVTEKTSDPKRWGRFYLGPLTDDGTGTNNVPRVSSARQTSVGGATDTLYEALYGLTRQVAPVVYGRPKPPRLTKRGRELPADPGQLLTIDAVQVDDIYDVIRRRRFKYPLVRDTRTVTHA